MLREIFYQQFADIKAEEWPRALMLSVFFFMVIATYWILKPLKRGVIINYFEEAPMRFFGMTFTGAEAEQVAKVINLVLVYLVVVLFIFLARKVARHHLVLIFAGTFAAAFALFASVIDEPSQLVVWSFYVFGDMFNTAMVALFWAFTNDVVAPAEARRTYGVIGLGGVVGGFFGATVVNQAVEHVGRDTLLFGCMLPMAVIVAIAYSVHRRTLVRDRQVERPAATSTRRNSAFEGAQIVFSSKYLLAIAGIIAVYEITSNVIDFQLAATVEREITASLEKDAFFGFIGQVVGVTSIIVQLFLTSFVLKRFGIRVALLFLPATIMMSAVGYVLIPGLLFASAMSVSDNALNYSINQSAKEALYVPTSQDVKYKAKAFIDMFVQRFAKVASVVVNLGFASEFVRGVRWLSFVTLAITVVWFALIRYLSTRFRRASDGRGGDESAAAKEVQE